ncbi:hypothetical protein [Paraglaciecola hydrolytica]|uniref:Uncharacterized protein n=1 Tax=Paraglaciecola hydrolytica TaxID=1799789 RepID=A0A136A1L3_9ALTE|nr:hypothetical protein [Paraglaciecola hydrolytica]KXI29138.1 hypothetical protein AX660_13360 [Paraglaciecola hydrolytica]
MNEGWLNDEYIVVFTEAESALASSKYELSQYLPGYTLVGLRGWDDLIVISPTGVMCSLPTIPIDPKMIVPFFFPEDLSLESDERFTGKVKWYLKPLIFGGNPQDEENLTWVSHEQHAELVVWWNNQYKIIKAQAGNA